MLANFPDIIYYSYSNAWCVLVETKDDDGGLIYSSHILPSIISHKEKNISSNKRDVKEKWREIMKDAVPIEASNCVNKLLNQGAAPGVDELTYKSQISTGLCATTNAPVTVRLFDWDLEDYEYYYAKLIIDDTFYTDSIDSELFDSIIRCGVSAGGLINARFVWATINSSVPRLVRIGSALYKKVVRSEELQAKDKIPFNDLDYGGVYVTRQGGRRMFLGMVDSYTCKNQLMWFLMDKDDKNPSLASDEEQFNTFLESKVFSTFFPRRKHLTLLDKNRRCKGQTTWVSRKSSIDRLLIGSKSPAVELCGRLDIAAQDKLIYKIHEQLVRMLRSNVDYFNSASGMSNIGYAKSLSILYKYYEERIHIRPAGRKQPEVAEYTDEFKILSSFI